MRSLDNFQSEMDDNATTPVAWFNLEGCRLRVEHAANGNDSGCLGRFSFHGEAYVILPWSVDMPAHALTRREREIALLIAKGRYTKQIAFELGISPHTASTYINRIRTKLGVRNRPEMIAALLGWMCRTL